MNRADIVKRPLACTTVSGLLNSDFFSQLAYFQMLRDELQLQLTDGTVAGQNDTGSARTHLLALWTGASADKLKWAIGPPARSNPTVCRKKIRLRCRLPDFIKLENNLDAL